MPTLALPLLVFILWLHLATQCVCVLEDYVPTFPEERRGVRVHIYCLQLQNSTLTFPPNVAFSLISRFLGTG